MTETEAEMATPTATVTIPITDCDECGSTTGPGFHGGDCGGVIISVGDEWRCSGCGARTRPGNQCGNCGASGRTYPCELPLAMRPSVSPETIERAVHEETNRRRDEHGVGTLAYSDHLSSIALQHSRDMSDRDYFAHESPDGNTAQDRYRRFGHDIRRVGENLSMQSPRPGRTAAELAEEVVDGWLDSPGHRENLLRSAFDEEGIGVYLSHTGDVYVTQNFC